MPTLSMGAVLPEKQLLIRVPYAGLRVMMPAVSSRAKARRTVIRLQPGEIPFRRQPVSRHVFAGQQAVDDPHPDLFGQISGTDGTPPVFVVL